MMMRQFVLRLAQPPVDAQVGRLFAGAQDVCVEVGAFRRWAAVLTDRGSPTLASAVTSTVRDLDAAGLVAIDVGPDEDIVPVPLIAERLGCHPRRVRRWASGESGRCGFPTPVDLPGGMAHYRWSEVEPWAIARLGLARVDLMPVFVAVNLSLRLRMLVPGVDGMQTVMSLISDGPP
ncbi:MAG: hypothetical protein HKP61_10525 [Dactylosporangium sp.]|nr:hypothetical protein [Dactylosporangium sp.]NNJ61364.1 hypothetical protein [Dactylosporangium sp.]